MEHRRNEIPKGNKNLTSTVTAHQTQTPTSQNTEKTQETTSETTSPSTNPTTTKSNNPGGQFILSTSTIIAIVLGICLFLLFFAILIKIVLKWRKKKTKICKKTNNNNSNNNNDVNHDEDRNCDELWENHHYEEIKITDQNLRSKSASFSVNATEESQDNNGEYNRISEIIVFETKPNSSEEETILIKDSSGYSHVIRKQSNPKIGQQIERTNNNSFECSQMIIKCSEDKNAEQEMNADSNCIDAQNNYYCIEEEPCVYNVLEDMTANNEKQNLYNEVENIQSNEEQVIKREIDMYKVVENASSSDQHDDKGTQNL